MLKINQKLITDEKELLELEEINHKGSFEYLPFSKEVKYTSLANGENVVFLSIKITANNGEKKDFEIIDENQFMALLVCSNRVLSSKKDEGFDLLSISYQSKLNISKKEGLFVNALILTDSQEELPHSEILSLEREISKELKLDSVIEENEEKADNISEDNDNTAPVSNNIDENKENDVANNIEKDDDDTSPVINNIKDNVNDNVTNNVNETINKNNKVANEVNEVANEVVNEVANKTTNEVANENNINNDIEIDEMDEMARLEKEFQARKQALLERKRLEKEKLEKEKLEKEEQERLEKEKLEKEEQERLEKERLEKEEQERLEKEEQERLEQERLEKEKQEKLKNLHSIKDRIKEEQMKNNSINEDTYVDFNYTDDFIKSFYEDYSKEYSGKQKDAYDNATEDVPFLNAIDKYTPTCDIRTLEEPTPVYELHEEDEFIQTTASKEKIKKSFAQVLTYFTQNESLSLRRVLQGEIEMKSFMLDVENYIKRNLQIPVEDMEMFLAKLKRAFFSYYVLIPAINDPNVTDIKVLSPDNINVKVNGEHYRAANLSFIGINDYIRFIEMILIRNKVTIGYNEILFFSDKNFHPDYRLRFNICLPAINSTEMPYLHIRKEAKKKMSLEDLINADMLDTKVASYLLDKVVNARGIVFAGPSASGKTHLLNALIDYIPKTSTVSCIQETEELFSNIHPATYFQRIKKDARGNILVGLSELGQNNLVCDAGYMIIGECKGKEVRDLLRASNTGHKCWCTTHSPSAQETIPRLADYVKYGSDYTLKEAERMLKDLEVIVYIEKFKIVQIFEIAGYDDEVGKLIYKPIFKRKLD